MADDTAVTRDQLTESLMSPRALSPPPLPPYPERDIEADNALRQRLVHTPSSRSDESDTIAAAGFVSNGADAEFNYTAAFSIMTGRRLQRRYRGVYRKYSFVAKLVTWSMVLYVLLVLATLSLSPGESRVAVLTSESPGETTADELFVAACILFGIYVVVQVALLIRWLIYWLVLAEMLTYALTNNTHALFWVDDTLSPADARARTIVLWLLVALEVLTVVVYLFTHYSYPWVVRTGRLSSTSWWTVKRYGTITNALSYRSIARFYTTKRNVVRYCGGLDVQNKPHGYGLWTDTSFHGERLVGQWAHGEPIGPFRSFEHGSGYSFVNLRIAYCHNRSEIQTDAIAFWPKHAPVNTTTGNGLHWGVASVECSVSGGFFTFLPAVAHLTPTAQDALDRPQSAAACAAVLRTPADDVVFSKAAATKQQTTPSKPALETTESSSSSKRQIFRENSTPVFTSSSSGGAKNNRKEALVLLHGYNCSLDYGLNRLAQLLALGDFPSFIHPFVFSWPSGGALAYFQAKKVGSESARTATDFRAFLRSLLDAGYSTLNVIAHSMGARVFFYCLAQGQLDDILQPLHSPTASHPPSPHATGSRRMKLSTLTFCNPDYSRDAFCAYGGGYDLARRFCDHVTLYADSMDGALFYLEFLSKPTLFGPLNYSLGRRGTMVHRDVNDNATDARDGRARTETQFAHWVDSNLVPVVDMDVAIAAINARGAFDGVAAFAYNRSALLDAATATAVAHNVATTTGEDAKPQYLDMDVIDTTWMDNNVHAIRHNYFNINPTIVDDLRHLIVGKKRAHSRPGLLQTTSAENVYIFLVAPSHVTNK